MKYNFSAFDGDGKELKPVYGPGFTGLINLGNSCYMASVLQPLFHLPLFQRVYHSKEARDRSLNIANPADDFGSQMFKLVDGLLSGKYSFPEDESKPSQPANGLRPFMYKTLISKGHKEFTGGRQQDAAEYLQYLLEKLDKETKTSEGKLEDM